MEELESAARLLRWMVSNFIHNLSFIPEEKLNWKPEPGVKSPLEIAAEVATGQRAMLPVFEGGNWTHLPLPQLTSRDEASQLLRETAEQYAAALESARPEQLDRFIDLFGNTVWVQRAVFLPVIDTMHHHGQITYIQSLLGDGEYHFDLEAAGRFFAKPGQPTG